ncbi:MAG: hypothetical protein AB7V58_06680 [Solirubrobacterales bacterium]
MASASKGLRAAAALGAASGARSFAGAAALALRGRPRAGWARAAILTLAAGEAVGDKLPLAPPRSDPPALAARLAAGAAVGAASAGARGARVGAAFALASAYASERARALLGERTGLPDPAIAVVEDAVVYGGACAAAAGRVPGRPLPALLAGPLAALVGTGAMTGAQGAYYKLTGAEASETPREVGEKIVAALSGKSVPEDRRSALNTAMHVLYGTSWGLPYGLLARRRPGPASGLALGAGVWAGSLAELPAFGVAPPPWRQPPSALAVDLGFHLLYGLATAVAVEALAA